MGIHRFVVGSIPTFFLVVGLAILASGVLRPADEGSPLSGTLLVLVGLTLAGSLWLIGGWDAGPADRE